MIDLAVESVSHVWDEALALAKAHHHEAGCLPDDDFDMNRPAYEAMEGKDLARIFTARDHGKLVAYACLMLCPGHSHYRKLKWAVQDSLFAVPAYRGPLVVRFLAYQDITLRDQGIHIVYRQDTLQRPYGRLLLHMGYTLNDRGYVKDLRGEAA